MFVQRVSCIIAASRSRIMLGTAFLSQRMVLKPTTKNEGRMSEGTFCSSRQVDALTDLKLAICAL